MDDSPKFLILRHIEGNSLSHLAPVLDRHGVACVYRDAEALENTDWPDPAEYDGLMILGGYEHLPEIMKSARIRHEIEFIREMIDREKPVFGICLGAQLIAASLGAPVRKNPFSERGWYTLNLTEDGIKDPVLGPLGNPFLQFHWHEDTYDLPENAARLAYSETCPQQAFRYENHVYGVQFHPEIDKATILEWISQAKTLTEKETTDMLSVTATCLARQQEANRAMLDRFLNRCAGNR